MANLTSSNLKFFPRSMTSQNGVEFGLAQTKAGNRLAVLADSTPAGFDGETRRTRRPHSEPVHVNSEISCCPARPPGVAAIRPAGTAYLGWHGRPDWPGHPRPRARCTRYRGGIAPIFTQQSIREMTRTGRSPQQVLDDATWGIFQEGWQEGFGADADHLKTPADIDACLAAGFTFFTIDPGPHMENRAETASLNELRKLSAVVPADLQPHASGLLNRTFAIEGYSPHFDETILLKAAVKYGRAIGHVATMYHHLAQAAWRRVTSAALKKV